MNQNGAPGLPPGIGAALRGAAGMDMPGLRPAAPAQVPPVDIGNPFLCMTDVVMTVERVDLDPDVPVEAQDYAGNVNVVPVGVRRYGGDGQPVRAVAFTLRTPAVTFTAFWGQDTARENLRRIKEVAATMPPIIQPPDVAGSGRNVPGLIVPASAATELGPDLRRLRITLRDTSRDYDAGSISVQFDAPHVAVVTDLIEQALYQLAGIVLPGQ